MNAVGWCKVLGSGKDCVKMCLKGITFLYAN